MEGERKHGWTPVLTLNLLLGVGTPESGAILGLWNLGPVPSPKGAGCVCNELVYLVPTPSMGSRGWEEPRVRAPSLAQYSRAPFFAHTFQGRVIAGTPNSARFAWGPFGS